MITADKVKKLQQAESLVRTGGKGTARRKRKVVHKTAATDDKKLQSNLKKLSVTNIPGIEEVNMIKEDGTVIHFNNPKVQASVPANTFAIVGHGENKQITEMLPGILNQLGAESLTHLKRLANNVTSSFAAPPTAPPADHDDDDDVPEITDMLPGILNQLGAESLTHLKRLANNVTSSFAAPPTAPPTDHDDDEDVPEITDMLSGILNQLGAESLTHLKRLANNVTSSFAAPPTTPPADHDDDDDVPPELVGDFDEPSKEEAKVEAMVEAPISTDE